MKNKNELGECPKTGTGPSGGSVGEDANRLSAAPNVPFASDIFVDRIMERIKAAITEYDPFPEPVDERDFLENIRDSLNIEFGVKSQPQSERIYWTTPPTPTNSHAKG